MDSLSIKNSQFVRILLVTFLILILQIPTVMLQGIVRERQNLRNEAIGNITSKWGQQQILIGPRLVVPYIKRVQSGKTVKAEVKYGIFLPENLQITGKMDTEVRYRGIFEVPVYKSTLDLRGRFLRPDLSLWGVQPEDIRWDQAELSLQILDAHAIQNPSTLSWNKTKLSFAPGQGKYGGNLAGIHASLRDRLTANQFDFDIFLRLNGSERIAFAPFGQTTKVSLSSDWGNPSFQGLWLPNQRSVNAKGFEASWEIPYLGRNYPQQWNTEAKVDQSTIQSSVFGVDLISPVDNYRMAERSIKYNFLFLVLTFATFWLFEMTAQLRVHPLQYLLVGVAMSMFYLLQLALSEHIGFQLAYLSASIAVVVLITVYAIAILNANRRGGIVGVIESILYGYLYVVLVSQDYSLLLGSIGLFCFLAIAMYFTRQLNVAELDRTPPPPTAALESDRATPPPLE
jgi:inner membrane protein